MVSFFVFFFHDASLFMVRSEPQLTLNLLRLNNIRNL